VARPDRAEQLIAAARARRGQRHGNGAKRSVASGERIERLLSAASKRTSRKHHVVDAEAKIASVRRQLRAGRTTG
jgi:hypothetical protein